MASTNPLSTTSNPSPAPTSQQKQQSLDYLQSLLNQNLRITTTDSRMFHGSFKCTDSESNIVLKHTYEYRPPSAQKLAEEAAAVAGGSKETIKLDMTSRYLGLVVVPGRHIVRIEVEEFLSQMKGRGGRGTGSGYLAEGDRSDLGRIDEGI